MSFVYILRCGDGSLYTGAAKDLARRLAAHAAGKASRYTRARLPVALAWSAETASWGAALSEERRIKGLRRQGKLALIAAGTPGAVAGPLDPEDGRLEGCAWGRARPAPGDRLAGSMPTTTALTSPPVPARAAGRPRRPAISAIVTTFNEEANIAGCIESLLWCDEIFVVDSFSTDRTAEIVRGFPNVRFFQRTYYGSASQKNWAMDQVAHDWILIFDADERCTPELHQEIDALLAAGPRAEGYTIKRRVYFLGHVIRFSGWQHDQVVRLVRKGSARYPNRRVHADMITRGPTPVLRNPMEHYMAETLDEYARRIEKYSFWGASQNWRDGRRSGFLQVFGRSIWRFFRTYIFQLGILDGMHGLVFCMLQSYGSYLKWALLWGWHVNAARGRMPNLPIFDEDKATWRGIETEGEGGANLSG